MGSPLQTHGPTQSTQANHAPEIELDSIRVRLGEAEILRDISLRFPAGKITAILGPSGCGKSTLLKLIAGLLTSTSGEVRFTASNNALRKLTPGQLAYVFQDAALMPWRSVKKNVAAPLELLGATDRNTWTERIDSQLRSVSLDPEHWSKYPDELSGGMRMRVSIARALVTDPEVLLLDEPFSALDDILRRRLGELVLSLWRTRPRTILLVTHNIDEAILLSHRIIVMGPGTVAAELPIELPETADEDPRQSAAFAEYYRTVARTLREAFQ